MDALAPFSAPRPAPGRSTVRPVEDTLPTTVHDSGRIRFRELYWFGVKHPSGDFLASTLKDPSDVPRSETVRTLGEEHTRLHESFGG